MYLLLLGIIAVGAGLLLVYYSVQDKKAKPKATAEDSDEETKGKVIYLFDEDAESEDKKDKKEKKNKSDEPNDTPKDDKDGKKENGKKDD